ncbi:atrial natriuretic peptide receptor A [Schistosoma japonicum]|nr:atrial natriuretic peptide receptor A [Schistosoma japonicum]
MTLTKYSPASRTIERMISNQSTIDRNLNHPIWLDNKKCMNYATTTKMNYTRFPNRRLTPAATSVRLRRGENSSYLISDHQRTPSAPNTGYDIPVNYQTLKEENNLFNSHRPRLLLRRKDSIQAAPPYILPEDRSLYKSTFTGQTGTRPQRIQPREQGINGLETTQQRVSTLLKSKHLTDINDDDYKQIYALPNDSTYRTDFNEQIFEDVYSNNQLPTIHSNNHDHSTEYNENYHTWIKPSMNNEIIQRIGYNWRPTPAIYLPEDHCKHEPMESSSMYRMNFINYSKETLNNRIRPSDKACYSAIKADKLLSSYDGKQEQIPKSLYRDSFIGLHGVDNWSDRHTLQNTSSITLRTGRHQQNDEMYWFGVDTTPFNDTKESMFTKSCYLENPYEKLKV